MTATLERASPPGPTRPREPATRPRGAPPESSPTLLPVAEAALALVMLAGVAGLARVFTGTDFLPRLALAAVAAHLTAAVVRRRRFPAPLALAVSAAGLVLVGTWVIFPSTTVWGLPTAATLDAAHAALADAWADFGTVQAPVRAHPGYVLAAFLGVWIGATVADRAAFRAWMVLPPLVPAGTVFVVGALLARGQHRIWATTLFLATASLFVLLQRQVTLVAVRRWRWLPTDERRGTASVMRTGLVLLAVAAASAALLGPNVPGAGSPQLVDWRPGDGQGGGGERTTDSPLVDIRSRLVDLGDEVVFTVRSDQPAYWRTTSLEIFDGRIWRSSGSFREADGDLPAELRGDVEREVISQQVQVAALGQIWLPAAFQPVAFDPAGTPARFDPESSTLIVDSDQATSDGAVYEVRSLRPAFDPDELQAATGPVPESIGAYYLALPDDFSAQAEATAAEVVAGAATPYAQALALQEFFRTGFTYSLEVEPGHGDDAIDAFLERRTGYCEQFAGTYAAMARSVGLPSRVAVGFTQGEVDPAEPTEYTVRGRQAHAWPEVWLTGAGWVPFEPTPGRGAPDAEQWTGVPEGQDGGPPADATSTTATSATATATSAPGATSTTQAPSDAQVAAGQPAPSEGGGPNLLRWWPLGLVAVVLLLWIVGLPLLQQVRRRQRLADPDPDRRVQEAWSMVVEDLAAVGLRPRPAETPAEVADRSDDLHLTDPEVPRRLARSVTAARYSPTAVSAATADQAVQDAETISAAVDARLRRRDRWRRRLDPRPLLRRTT